MKVLYLSCHAVLEYDELRIFEELGIDYFSLGSYINPRVPVDPIRPALKMPLNTELYHMAPDRNAMPREFIEKFDCVIVMHLPEWIENNWEVMKDKIVIWRTIGQSSPAIEQRLKPYRDQGLKVVRFCPTEERMSNYIGQDALIRFYKDPAEFGPYTGEDQEVITFAQNMKTRGEFCNYEIFEKATEGLNAHVYGPKNEESGELNGGFLTYEQMRDKYRKSRVYFYTGTQPSAYVLNFIEAWMSGIPVVAIGPKLANSLQIAGDSYEVQDLIGAEWEPSGFVSDDINQLKEYVVKLYNDLELCKKVGEKGRQKAIEIFGIENIKKQWQGFFETIL